MTAPFDYELSVKRIKDAYANLRQAMIDAEERPSNAHFSGKREVVLLNKYGREIDLEGANQISVRVTER